jgi:hypothetical protein
MSMFTRAINASAVAGTSISQGMAFFEIPATAEILDPRGLFGMAH